MRRCGVPIDYLTMYLLFSAWQEGRDGWAALREEGVGAGSSHAAPDEMRKEQGGAGESCGAGARKGTNARYLPRIAI